MQEGTVVELYTVRKGWFLRLFKVASQLLAILLDVLLGEVNESTVHSWLYRVYDWYDTHIIYLEL